MPHVLLPHGIPKLHVLYTAQLHEISQVNQITSYFALGDCLQEVQVGDERFVATLAQADTVLVIMQGTFYMPGLLPESLSSSRGARVHAVFPAACPLLDRWFGRMQRVFKTSDDSWPGTTIEGIMDFSRSCCSFYNKVLEPAQRRSDPEAKRGSSLRSVAYFLRYHSPQELTEDRIRRHTTLCYGLGPKPGRLEIIRV